MLRLRRPDLGLENVSQQAPIFGALPRSKAAILSIIEEYHISQRCCGARFVAACKTAPKTEITHKLKAKCCAAA
jgi:hypothetical protein